MRKKNARELCGDGKITNAITSYDYETVLLLIYSSTSASSFLETAARIVTASPLTKATSNPVQLGVGDIIMASSTAASLFQESSWVMGMTTGSTSPSPKERLPMELMIF